MLKSKTPSKDIYLTAITGMVGIEAACLRF